MKEPLVEDETFGDTFEPWSAKRASILSKYTTSEKLSITTSFLSQSDKDKGIKNNLEYIEISLEYVVQFGKCSQICFFLYLILDKQELYKGRARGTRDFFYPRCLPDAERKIKV